MRHLAAAVLGAGAATGLAAPAGAWLLPARGEWPTYLADATRSSFAWQESVITPGTVGSLHADWRLPAGGSVSGQAVVAGGRVYWGSWDGLEHATTIAGDPVWSVNLGTSTDACDHITVGVAGTAAVSAVEIHGVRRSVVFVGGGKAQIYALDAATGAVLWGRRLGPPGAGFVWSSPLVYDGSVYIGLASESDCPLVRGKLFKLDAATGTAQDVHNIVPLGCTGGSIWSSPTLDAARGTIYVTTGNDGRCGRPESLTEAMVEVRASDLAVLGSWAIPDSARVADSDFGATATLFTASLRGVVARAPTALVGAVNKNGIYYAFRRDHVAAGPVWQAKIGWGGSNPETGGGAIAPSAFAGGRLFVAGGTASVGGTTCRGTLRAVNPATGAFEWQDCLPGPVLGAVIMARGLVFVSCGSHIIAVSSGTGKVLLDRIVRGAAFEGPPSIAAGVLYQGDMNGRLLSLSP